MVDPTHLLLVMVTVSLTSYFALLIRLKPSAEAKLSTFMDKKPAKERRKSPESKKPSSSPRPEKGVMQEPREKKCPHYLGYLTTLPKGTSFPEECFGCRQVIRCMRIEPTETIESFYLEAAKPEETAQ
jgi:hypothetical protein